MRHYTTKETAAAVGISTSVLMQWFYRYGWPRPVQKDNGFYLWSELAIADMRRFVAAGRPFHQIVCGTWNVDPQQAAREDTLRPIISAYDDLEPRWIRALELRIMGTIAEYLASLGRMRPAVRAQYVRSAQEADRVTGGEFSHILRRFGVEATP